MGIGTTLFEHLMAAEMRKQQAAQQEQRLRHQQELEQGRMMRGLVQQKEDVRDKEFGRNLELAKLESSLAQRFGQDVPIYDNPFVQRLAQASYGQSRVSEQQEQQDLGLAQDKLGLELFKEQGREARAQADINLGKSKLAWAKDRFKQEEDLRESRVALNKATAADKTENPINYISNAMDTVKNMIRSAAMQIGGARDLPALKSTLNQLNVLYLQGQRGGGLSAQIAAAGQAEVLLQKLQKQYDDTEIIDEEEETENIEDYLTRVNR